MEKDEGILEQNVFKAKGIKVPKEVGLGTLITLLLVPIFWGGAFSAAKIALQEMAPLTAAFLRFMIASLCLIPIMIIKDKEGWKAKIKDIPWLMLLGLTGIFAYNVFFFYGLKETSTINGSLIVASNPGITALLAVFLLKEKLKPIQIGGILLSFFGVVFVISKGSVEVLSQLEFNSGDFLFLGATFTWAIYSIVGKKIMGIYSPLTATTYAVIFGAIFLLPFAIKDLFLINWRLISFETWLAIIYMALFASVIAFVWWYQGVKKIGASRAAVFVNLVPISAMILAVVFGETLTFVEVLGAGLVIGGVYLTTIKK